MTRQPIEFMFSPYLRQLLARLLLLEVVKALASVRETPGREINPVVMTTEKFAERLVKRDRFATRVLGEPKVFVLGDEDELAELAEDRTTGRA